MTKDYCDICGTELAGEHAGVSILAKDCDFQRMDFCLPCFYDRKNWSKIHFRPKKRESVNVRIKKFANKAS